MYSHYGRIQIPGVFVGPGARPTFLFWTEPGIEDEQELGVKHLSYTDKDEREPFT